MAPLFLGFSCFLYEHARKHEVDSLNFCTREGVFFKTLFDTLFDNHSAYGSQIRTNLLEASRLSTFAPSALKDGRVDFERLFSLYRRQSPATILTSLGLETAGFEALVSGHAVDMDEMFDQTSTDPRLHALLADERFLAPIRSHLARMRATTKGYLDQAIGNDRNISFVDIGWQGTIQDSIAILYPDKQITGLYLGRALQRNPIEANCTKTAYGPDRNRAREALDLLDAVNVIEFVCLSNGGSASHYVKTANGTYSAVMVSNEEEDLHVERFALPFQAGVLAAAEQADTATLLAQHESGELRKQALAAWREMLKQPSPELVDAYFSLKSNEQFGYGSINDQSSVPPLSTVLAAPFSTKQRQRLIRYLTYSQWVEGMLGRRDLGRASRVMYFLLMKTALAYKRLQQDARFRHRDRQFL